jgi:hypothetical protein
MTKCGMGAGRGESGPRERLRRAPSAVRIRGRRLEPIRRPSTASERSHGRRRGKVDGADRSDPDVRRGAERPAATTSPHQRSHPFEPPLPEPPIILVMSERPGLRSWALLRLRVRRRAGPATTNRSPRELRSARRKGACAPVTVRRPRADAPLLAERSSRAESSPRAERATGTAPLRCSATADVVLS